MYSSECVAQAVTLPTRTTDVRTYTISAANFVMSLCMPGVSSIHVGNIPSSWSGKVYIRVASSYIIYNSEHVAARMLYKGVDEYV